MTTRDEMRKRLQDDEIAYLLVQFVDIHGAAKCKMVPASELDTVIDVGAGFAGGAVWGSGQGPHSHDLMARIDLETYTPLPWLPNTARFAANIFVDDQPHSFCARTNLIRVLSQLQSAGFTLNVGMEPEFFLVTRNADGSISPWDPDGIDTLAKPCYDFRGLAPAIEFLQDLTAGLNQLGWGVYQCDHEDANGQFEVNFAFADALTTADRVTFFKMTTSQVAKKYGAIATHMPKPFSDRTGSGLHAHFSLADAESGKNVFVDPNDRRGLGHSTLGYHFLAGVLHHARALAAVTNPTVNCYKRLKLGRGLLSSRSGFTWVPAFASYGDNNRTQMIRSAGPGHLEDRTMSSGCNPYLALAALAAAGWDGVMRKLEPCEPNLGNLYDKSLEEIQSSGIAILPQSLHEALDCLQQDAVILESLGPIADVYLSLKQQEWETYDRQVSDWEVQQYLTFF
ncbi:MAG: type III glutamate--ammonia ligase [Planctomycetaceae bacterium]